MNLNVRPGVVLTGVMIPVIEALDPWFVLAKKYAEVTSGKRDPEEQLDIIKRYAKTKNVDREFPDIITAKLEGRVRYGKEDAEVYSWVMAWSRLLQEGVMISPPITAACLFDYEHPTKGLIKAGTVKQASEHFCQTNVHPFDVGGGGSGINDKLDLIQKAHASGTIPGFVDFLVEHENNAIHIRCRTPG